MTDLIFHHFKPVEEYLLWVPGDRGERLRQFHSVNWRFNEARGSSHNHQWWEGGYRDHLTHMLNLAEMMISSMVYQSVPKPDWGNLVLAIYFHDIEKLFKYAGDGEWAIGKMDFLTKVLPETFKLTLPQEVLDAIKYAHGEGDDYRKDKRVMNPLGAIVHAADILSARWLFDRRVHEGKLESVSLDRA